MKDFFARQAQARLNTRRLVPYFLLAFAGTVAALYFSAWLAWAAATPLIGFVRSVNAEAGGQQAPIRFLNRFWIPELFLGVLSATALLMIGGSMSKFRQLGKGGRAVALALGGHRLDPQSDQPDERQLLNVVEEMSIASGIPVPEVYTLEGEDSINAFAAGHGIDDAVVGVTRGALRYLSGMNSRA